MITWPAVIKYSQDDELTFITQRSQWDNDPDLYSFDYDPLDYLIDSAGLIHSLNTNGNDRVEPTPTGDIITLNQAITIVQAHFSLIGYCCSAKILANSVAELIDFVGSAIDD